MIDKIIEHIDLWTSAQTPKNNGRGRNGNGQLYGIKKLRELILELAVRGKLVPQDPNDEPAGELLKRISFEEKKLVKEKKIKKPKDLSKISEEEIPFDLPEGWVYVRLNNLGEWRAGATPLRNKTEYYGGDIPWFKSGELTDDYISQSEETVTELALKETSLRFNKPGDVLIAMYGATIGKTSILTINATTNQAVCACTPFAGMYNVYLLTLLKAFKNRFIAQGAGGAQPNISREKIIATVIALPPLAEQHRIVAKVDELMALCDQLEQQQNNSIATHQKLVETVLETLTRATSAEEFKEFWQRIAQNFDTLFTTEQSIDLLKQTILQLAVMGKLVPQDPNDEPASELLKRIAKEKEGLVKEGKIRKGKPLPPVKEEEVPYEVPKGWVWCRLGDIIFDTDAGKSPHCEKRNVTDNEWGVLTTTSIQINKFEEDENKILPPNYKINHEQVVELNDILITRAGPLNRTGISCVVKNITKNLILSDKTIRLKYPNKLISPDFITLAINSPMVRNLLILKMSGMAESQVNISQERLKSIVFPVLPTTEQKRIVAKVDELFAICDALKERIVEGEELKVKMAEVVNS